MEYVKLEELVDIYLGITHTPQYVQEGVPFLSVKDISGGKIDFTNCKYVTKEEFESFPEGAKPKLNDLLFCRVGTIGKPILIDETIQQFGSFVSLGFLRKRNDDIYLNYLKYWMNSSMFSNAVRKNAKGASQVNLNTGWLKKFNVPMYSLNKQQEIVSILDKINAIIDADKKQLELLDETVKSRFIEMFGDIEINTKKFSKLKLENVMNVKGRVGWKGYTKADLRNEGPLVLGATHISKDGRLDLSEPVYLSKEKYDESPEIKVQKNDLIFGQRGTLGVSGLVTENIGEATINPCVLILRPIKINPQFARFMLIIYKEVGSLDRLNSGSSIPMISQKSIKEFKIVCPPIELQNEFANFVELIDKSKFNIQQHLNLMQELLDKKMEEFFGGE